MKKLWEKDKKLNEQVEDYETKDDLLCDQKLIPYDIYGSIAHAMMLAKIGFLTQKELDILIKGLKEIFTKYHKVAFILQQGDEDMHTKIEQFLTETYGEVGKKIHTGRSRNDQILTALRLFEKDALLSIRDLTVRLAEAFITFAKQYGHIPMPGYTHMQKAMPSSISLWAGSFAASFIEDAKLLEFVYSMIDQSPLGSAASYGTPLPLDRKYCATLLGFAGVQENPLQCQNSRGKIEIVIVNALLQDLLTINKFASDVLLFTTSEFGFFTVDDGLCSGSSIMPQKKNIDIAELLRSKVHSVLGFHTQMVSLSTNLMSGYHRDFQDTKKPLMESFAQTASCLEMAKLLLENLTPHVAALQNAMTSELFATHEAYKLVAQGVPFRDAYRKVGKHLNKITPDQHTTNWYDTSDLKEMIRKQRNKLTKERKRFHNTLDILLPSFAKPTAERGGDGNEK